MPILDFLKSVESFIILGIGVLLWIIRNEILKFKLEVSEHRASEASRDAKVQADLENHIEADEKFQDRIEHTLSRLHQKIDHFNKIH